MGFSTNEFDEREFHEINRKLKGIKSTAVKPYIKDITISCTTDSYFYKIKENVEKDRSGEVVFCVLRPDGKIVVVTCREYPAGIFRIPTGGIKHKENIISAVFREVREELGIETEIVSFIGALKIKFRYSEESVMFYSYLFLLNETGGRLLKDASDNEISEVLEVNLDGLETVVNSLANIKGSWSDWGRFRYESSNAILQYLRSLHNESYCQE